MSMELERIIWYTLPLTGSVAAVAMLLLANIYVVDKLNSKFAVRVVQFLAIAGGTLGTAVFYMVVVGYLTNVVL